MFFDGTGNNYAGSFNRQDHSESNVARLYSAFPGLSVPGVLPPQTDWVDPEGRYDNYFRIYVPGVGTPFPQVGDSGGGWIDGPLGGAAGLHGQVRLLWALAQVINAVHRFFTRRMLLGHEAIDAANQAPMIDPHAPAGHPIIRHLKHWLETLHEAIRPHILTPGQKRPGNIRPAIVRHLYLATFGFSRGAAEARAFVNWLVRLCKLDAQLLGRPEPMTLAGFPLSHDFLGLFDTVASVGLANLSVIADGHGGWADAQRALRVPREAGRCLHLVAAHENRRSFPLDSIHVGDELPANGEELVYPGVHSDIGGGYRPGDQGKGTEELGADMLSRLPLAEMYRQARLAGVPLKLEHAEPDVQDGYKITPRTIADFNAYLGVFETRSGGPAAIVREHWR
ncbi:DUF2235 domain-containing protein, partial [Arhodomonas aquaeolei]|uniref:T6SS phospholipase effector Tle1-like catalytic domain-containing protein n=1 Tax=Arhodomonas aquaeolei TaxID=2369 RepID=UPI00216A3C1A